MIGKQIALLHKLSTKLVAIVFMLSFVPLTLLYFFSTNAASAMLIESLRDDLREKSYLVGADIDRFFRQRERDVRILSQADVLESNRVGDIIRYLTEIIAETPYLSDLDIIGMDGVFIASSGEQNERGRHILAMHPTLEELFDDVLASAQGHVFVSEVLDLDAGPGLAFLTPITDSTNTRVIKVLLVEINLDVVAEIVADFDDRVIGDKYVYLVDNAGRVIVTGDPDVGLLESFPDLSAEPGLLESFSRQGEVGSVIYEDATGEMVMAGFADMAEFGDNRAMDWSIIAVAPLADITRPVNDFKRTLLITTSIVFVVATLVIFLTGRTIYESVNKLVIGAQRVGEGDLQFRVVLDRHDEFGYLAEQFNAMVSRLETDFKLRTQLDLKSRHAQKLEAIGTLASGVAHEINNPLMGIMNYAQLIDERLDAESPLREFASEIGLETERVAAVVRSLLAFASQEEGTHSPAHLRTLVEDTITLIRTIIRRDQITLDVDIPDDLPTIKCRSQQIQQVIMNLLTNARDALNARYPEHNPDKKMRVTVLRFDNEGRDWIRITVEDHGDGIPDTIRDRVFDPFFTTKGRSEGTGLGLAISHSIITEHHGELSFECEVGQHTRFHVDLPVDNGWSLDEVPRNEAG